MIFTENCKISPDYFNSQIKKNIINQKIKKKVHYESEFTADSEKKIIFCLGLNPIWM